MEINLGFSKKNFRIIRCNSAERLGTIFCQRNTKNSNTKNIFPEIFVLIFVRNPYNFDIYNLTFSDYGLLFHILIRVRCADFLYFGRTKNEVFEPTTRRKHET